MAQLSRLEDISAVRSSTVRYLISTIGPHHLQSTLKTLQELAEVSVSLHRYILRHALSSVVSTLKILSPTGSGEESVIALHVNDSTLSKEEMVGSHPTWSSVHGGKEAEDALVQLTRSFVLFTLDKPNAITLLGGAFDFLAPPPTATPFSSPTSTSRGTRFAPNSSTSSPLSPGSSSSLVPSPAVIFPSEVLQMLLKQTLQLKDLQVLLFAGALAVGSRVASVREAAPAVVLALEQHCASGSDKKNASMLRSLTFLHKLSSTSFSGASSVNLRSTTDAISSSPPPLTKAFETQLEQFVQTGSSTSLSSNAPVPGVSLVSLNPTFSLLSEGNTTTVAKAPLASTSTHTEGGPLRVGGAASVSIGAILREVGTGCVTTTADSKELLRLLGKKITEADIAEVLGFFASSAMTNVNDPSAYRMLSAIFSATTELMEADGDGETDTASGSRDGKSGTTKAVNAAATGNIGANGSSSTNPITPLGKMMMSGGGSGVVNARPLLDAMHASGDSYDWDEVIRLLDVPDEDGFEPSTISLIFDAYHSFHKKPLTTTSTTAGIAGGAAGGNAGLSGSTHHSSSSNSSGTSGSREYPPITLFLGSWKNTKRQRSALMYILQNPEKCNMKVLEEVRASRDTQGSEGGKGLLPPALVQAIMDEQNAATGTSCALTSSPPSPNRVPLGSTASSGTTGNGNFSSSSSTSLLTSMSALHLWGSLPFMEAALHVASREARFDEEVLQPAVRTIPLLFLYVLLGHPRLKYSMKALTVIKNILANPAYRPSVERMTTFILPQAENGGNLSAWINLLSELTISQPASTVDVLEMVLQVKSVRFALETSSSPRLVVGLAMCMEEEAKNHGAAGIGTSGEHSSKPATAGSQKEASEPWLQRALDGQLQFSASSTSNRFAVAMYIVEIAEMLLAKSRYRESAITALRALLNTPLKDMLPQIEESARALLASVDYLFPSEIEDASSAIFEEMYKLGSVETAIERVRALRASSEATHKQMYACLVHIMFDEAASIHHYPEKGLQLFGQLFGRLMVEDLLPATQVARAWSLLLSAIVKPPNTATGEYGIFALKEIKPRLAEWPQYCRAMRNVKDLDFRIPGVMAAIYRSIKEDVKATGAVNAAGPGVGRGGASLAGTSGVAKKPEFVDPAIIAVSTVQEDSESGKQGLQFHTLNMKAILADESITSPPPVIQDQINFLVSNTDTKNVQRHAEDMATQLRPEYYEYFAHYLVVKRAALEPNNHALYIELVQRLQSKELNKSIRVATISAVKRLLDSRQPGSLLTDQCTILGNLGLWLGGITIQQDIPLLASELDFEAILAQGLREQRLLAASILMSRVLESCAKSSLFAPPNPWTMSQLSLFLQVYELPGIRSRIHLELDILLSKLKLSMQSLKSFSERLQRNRSRQRHSLLQSAYESLDRSQPHQDFMGALQEAVHETSPSHSRESSFSMESAQLMGQEGSVEGSTRSVSQRTSNLQPTAEPFQPQAPATSPGVSTGLDFSNRPPGNLSPAAVQTTLQASAPVSDTASAGLPLNAPPVLPPPIVTQDDAPRVASPIPVEMPFRHERPPIELDISRFKVPPALENFVPCEFFRTQALRVLRHAMDNIWKPQIIPPSNRAVACTTFMLAKEREQLGFLLPRDMPIEGAISMARSLAANECFVNMKKSVGELIRTKLIQLILASQRALAGGGTSASGEGLSHVREKGANDGLAQLISTILEPFFVECESLCLRVIEYEAGQRAVEELRKALEKLKDPSPPNHPLPAKLPVVAQSFRDFAFCFPASTSFMQALRKVEDLVNRSVQASPDGANGVAFTATAPGAKGGNLTPTSGNLSFSGTGATTGAPDSHSAAAANAGSSQKLDLAITAEKKYLESLITYESAVYIAGPMVLRLFAAARLDEDRKRELKPSDGKNSTASSTVVSNNTSTMSVLTGTSQGQVGGPGVGSSGALQHLGGGVSSGALGTTGNACGGSDFIANTMPTSVTAGVQAEDGAAEVARRKKVSQALWRLYLDILSACLSRNEDPVREEISTVFLQQDGRFGHNNLVVDLLRLGLINFARLDSDLMMLLSRKGMKTSVSGFVAKMILADRVLLPSQIKKTYQALTEAVRQVTPSVYRASPLLSKPLMEIVRKEIQTLILPIDIPVSSERSYYEISQELDEWIALKKRHRSGGSGSGQGSTSGNSRDGSSSSAGGGGMISNTCGSAGGAGGSSSQNEGGSGQTLPWFHVYLHHLQEKRYLEFGRLYHFLNSLVCLCIEDHATRVLHHERAAAEKSNFPLTVPYANTTQESSPLLNEDPWSPPLLNPNYDPSVFTKCDYFVSLFGVLLRCVSTRPDETNIDQRADISLLRRVLDATVHILQQHHNACQSLNKWKPPQLRHPPPPNSSYIPVFMQQPYVRILSNLLLHIHSFKPDHGLTLPFLGRLHKLNPLDYPGFAFGWLEIVSHRILLQRTLRDYNPMLWDAYAVLLVDALHFIAQGTQRQSRLPATVLFFKTFEKLVMIIHHDFPHFLLAYHYLLYSETASQHLYLLNLYSVRLVPQKQSKLNALHANSSSSSPTSSGAGAGGEEQKGGGSKGSGGRGEGRSSSALILPVVSSGDVVMPPVYPFLPIDAVMRDLESQSFGFAQNLGLLEAWTAALTAQAARNRDIFREHPYEVGSTADSGSAAHGRISSITPGATVMNAVLSNDLLKALADHIKGMNSARILHALALQAFFITAGVSFPQLKWINAHSTDGESDAASEDARQKRLTQLILEFSSFMPDKIPLEVFSKNPLSPVLHFFRYLSEHLDPARRYFLFHACAHHLRVDDSAETAFFCEVFLYLFQYSPSITLSVNSDSLPSSSGFNVSTGGVPDGNEGKNNSNEKSPEAVAARRLKTGIEEQVVRVLLERVLTYRPQPPGAVRALRAIMDDKDFKKKNFSGEFSKVLSKLQGPR